MGGRVARWRGNAAVCRPRQSRVWVNWWHSVDLREARDGWPWWKYPGAKEGLRQLPCIDISSGTAEMPGAGVRVGGAG
jgi:hypothetical protein